MDHAGPCPLTSGQLAGFADGAGLYIGWRNEAIHGEARDIEGHLLDRPRLLHPCLGVAHGHFTKPEQGDHRAARMGYHYAFDRTVIIEEGVDGGLPVHSIAAGIGLDSGKVRVLHVDEQPGSLAEVAKEDMPYDLCRAFASSFQCLRISTELENEAILP